MNQPKNLKQYGETFYSYGGSFQYQIIGACCLLYDKAQMKGWDGKGNRFVRDIPTARYDTYSVVLLGYKNMYQHYFNFPRDTIKP